ncbi:MAG: GNAT family protein [Hyphomicrobiaceae bacterium]
MSLLLPWLGVVAGTGLRSARLILEVPCRAHYRQWSDLRATSRRHLEPYEPQWATDELSRAAFRRRLRRYAFERREDMGFAYFVTRKDDGILVGGVTLSAVRRGVTQSASVGYWIGSPYIRQGYASEALRVVLAHAFTNLGLHRVEAACMPRNGASIAVLEGATFRREGLARRYLKINGRWEDHLLYARLAEDGAVENHQKPPARPDDEGWQPSSPDPVSETNLDVTVMAKSDNAESRAA